MQEKHYSFNGVNIYSLPNQNLRSFCMALYIRAGSFYETEKNNGIGHLFEHAVFRNIKRKYPNFYEDSALHGVDLQGTTYKEFIQFEITGPSWIDAPSVKEDGGASSEPKNFDAEVIAPDKKKLSGLKITLALTASIISAAVAASTNESDVGMVLAIMAIPFIAMWAWALKKK